MLAARLCGSFSVPILERIHSRRQRTLCRPRLLDGRRLPYDRATMACRHARLIAAFLSLVTVAAQAVCGCPMRVNPASVSHTTKNCEQAKPCCHVSELASRSDPGNPNPCHRCNYVHPTDKAVSHDNLLRNVGRPRCCPFRDCPAFEHRLTLADFRLVDRTTDLPIPPFLADLFHARHRAVADLIPLFAD